MDTSTISDPEAKSFIGEYLRNREINRKFYSLVPEEKFDYRMVDTQQRKSDTPRESIVHQIDTERDYINAVKTGEMKFGVEYEDLRDITKFSKQQLLHLLENTDKDLIRVLSSGDIASKKVKVPWLANPIPAVSSLWSLHSHEILHQGWNLALMDHLDIARFEELKQMWG